MLKMNQDSEPGLHKEKLRVRSGKKREKRLCFMWGFSDYHWRQRQEMMPETKIWGHLHVGWLRAERTSVREGVNKLGERANTGSGRRYQGKNRHRLSRP